MYIPEDLPDEYTPGQNREEEPRLIEPMYAAGYAKDEHNMGMFAGPSPNLMEMLEVIPDDDQPAFIVYFGPIDGEHVLLYRWHRGKQAWIRLRQK